ncbi:FixH family protein [Massilia aerilata]|uniref:FixH family protein n=1 Tax=Massilia aerilata TaxID=453817 RepID=A0ABW0RZH5_9BURK
MKNLVRLFACGVAVMALNGCSMFSPPADLDVRTTRQSAEGKYVVSMHPVPATVPLNRIHAWEISVATAGGEPVTGAQIGFDGGMPQHGHGFPTQPRVTEELGNGRYRLDGVKFSMTGWWEMKLRIQAGAAQDRVTFNTVVAEPAAERSLAAR